MPGAGAADWSKQDRRGKNQRKLDYTQHTCYTYYTCSTPLGRFMAKQNITLSLGVQTIRKAKILAARRGSSISSLLAQQVELLVGEEEAYERAARQAELLLDQGFHLGGVIHARREEWHER